MLLRSSEKQKDLLDEIVAMVDAYENKTLSVLQDWVTGLPLCQQKVLLFALRDYDLTPQYPLNLAEKNLVEKNLTGFIRCSVMRPFDERENIEESNCFMQSRIDFQIFKPLAFGHCSMNFVVGLIHALKIIAYCSPNTHQLQDATKAYNMFADLFHLNIEADNVLME